MKKLLSIVIAVMAALCCLGLTACGSSLAGTYKLESVTIEGKTTYAKDDDPEYNFVLTDTEFTLTKPNETAKGTYEKSGALLTFTLDNGKVFTATLTGNSFQTSFKDQLDRNNCWTFNLNK